ncbi:hypothetical protein TTHERM_00770640 (macronuclear) [Tetrahymena thermophila SB210]|uniref:Uncharacterized protein n=1 Tax=Tetrahymena thermophila (strain SB210) TaxID=312017 RepID=Q23AT1_TETTS|nr:hypothetical protein TTHERM_00770640 [Tetrahymena thermophila SB210]EAR93611.2 hypothetical protein TTHERM_00770640 [Tetrahymena thermophila SB210]|eukprot:XP_001013856.2 hypothetical protein TTHERM_00770640 [Tetrahymena thermophila SB210]
MIFYFEEPESSSKQSQVVSINIAEDNFSSQNNSDECMQTYQCKKRKQIQKEESNVLKKYKHQNKNMKKVIYGIYHINQQFCQDDFYKNCNNLSIQKMLGSQKLFFLAGDVYVELQKGENENKKQFYNQSRNILYVEKTEYGIQKELDSLNAQKDFKPVIYYLENSQDLDSYNLAQYLKMQSQLLSMISQSIQEVQNYYLNGMSDIEDIIIQRNIYLKNMRKKLIEKYSHDDKFLSISTISLSFKKQAFTMSNIFFSNSLMALLGGDNDTSNEYFKQGISNIFTSESRKKIMEIGMKVQQQNLEELEITTEDFELQTFDNFKISSERKATIIPINYPAHLQFQNFPLLNQKEKFIVSYYEFSSESIQNILLKRESQFEDLPYCKVFPENYQYYSQVSTDEDQKSSSESQKFLKKYYEKQFNKIQKQNILI